MANPNNIDPTPPRTRLHASARAALRANPGITAQHVGHAQWHERQAKHHLAGNDLNRAAGHTAAASHHYGLASQTSLDPSYSRRASALGDDEERMTMQLERSGGRSTFHIDHAQREREAAPTTQHRPHAVAQTAHGAHSTGTAHDQAMHQAVQRGKKGGAFVVTATGKKRYVKK